ncbi:DAK2 domain-containing protein [Cohnella fermenti]|uniref:DAK2 domain-containing protein n=2 Tax=Cohnella fermenti TaxID=2565925 RepID=A0A4S4BFW7_9BACL|nr:DAK2 domain-containing protein [Cohnella fermenti]
MVLAGAERLASHAERVNELNVFPVPDGDTGTNMNMTMTAGANELRSKPSVEVGRAAEVLAKGLLMGARGNSGVILSQLFRGFSRAVAGQQEIGAPAFAAALQQGVDTAYKSVVKPVEGTILTVAREAAKHGLAASRRTADLVEWMREIVLKASETLARTPDMLPVLKQVGVVDSGGQGLVYIYEGFMEYLEGRTGASDFAAPEPQAAAAASSGAHAAEAAGSAHGSGSAHGFAQAKIKTESIQFPYDMEFFVNRDAVARRTPFPEASFRKTLEKDGDSIILIDAGDIVKVHVHSRRPGDVLNAALLYGELSSIHILNMQDQHRELLEHEQEKPGPTTAKLSEGYEGDSIGVEAATGWPPEAMGKLAAAEAAQASEAVATVAHPLAFEMAPLGIVAVSMGSGNEQLLLSLGVDSVISGGQSMNPSTEDLVQAISSLAAHHIFILPNNSNVQLAAKQAAELADKPVTVIPTTSVPQGMAALLAYREEDPLEVNAERMTGAIEKVATGQITKAVRDTRMDGVDIREGQYIGILNKTIVASNDGLVEAARELLAKMLATGDEVVTILAGEGADSEYTDTLLSWIGNHYPDAEVEVHEGGQPLYPYWFMVESV